jgi:hypothetical protein
MLFAIKAKKCEITLYTVVVQANDADTAKWKLLEDEFDSGDMLLETECPSPTWDIQSIEEVQPATE